jgi:phytoene/squalene synthetase
MGRNYSRTLLAQSITWTGSKQAYYTARLMVDNNLKNDFFRAYAYFRWVDDMIDITCQSSQDRISFIERQKKLIDRLYNNEHLDDLTPEEEIAAELINHDKEENSKLQSFIRNMFAIIEFDSYRKGRLINQKELVWYSFCIGKSVLNGFQFFIGNGHPYRKTDNRYMVVIAAHISHLLRDMIMDIANGFINIPREYLEEQGISPENVGSPPIRSWVRNRVEKARQYFREGKLYLDNLNVLRYKIAGYWYCARFEGVLDTIERDGYNLRKVYNERKLYTLLKIAWLGVSLTFRHIANQVGLYFYTKSRILTRLLPESRVLYKENSS